MFPADDVRSVIYGIRDGGAAYRVVPLASLIRWLVERWAKRPVTASGPPIEDAVLADELEKFLVAHDAAGPAPGVEAAGLDIVGPLLLPALVQLLLRWLTGR